jgi:hypothetical protein
VTPSVVIGGNERFGEGFPFDFKLDAAYPIKTNL